MDLSVYCRFPPCFQLFRTTEGMRLSNILRGSQCSIIHWTWVGLIFRGFLSFWVGWTQLRRRLSAKKLLNMSTLKSWLRVPRSKAKDMAKRLWDMQVKRYVTRPLPDWVPNEKMFIFRRTLSVAKRGWSLPTSTSPGGMSHSGSEKWRAWCLVRITLRGSVLPQLYGSYVPSVALPKTNSNMILMTCGVY